jgi:hypothetical protein
MGNIPADDTGLMADLSNDMVDTVKDDTSVLDGNAPAIVDDSTDESIGVDDSSVTSIDVSGSLEDATQSVNDESITVDSATMSFDRSAIKPVSSAGIFPIIVIPPGVDCKSFTIGLFSPFDGSNFSLSSALSSSIFTFDIS